MASSLPSLYQRSMYQLLLYEDFLTMLVDEKEEIPQTMSWLKKLINFSTLADEIRPFLLRLWVITYRKNNFSRHNFLEFVVKSLTVIVELIEMLNRFIYFLSY